MTIYYILITIVVIAAIFGCVMLFSFKSHTTLTSRYRIDPTIINGKSVRITISDSLCKTATFLIPASYYHEFDDHPVLEITYGTLLFRKQGRIYDIVLRGDHLI